MRLLKMMLIVVLVAAAAQAQEKKMVRAGGAGPNEETKDWPKLATHAGITNAQIGEALNDYLDALAKRDLFSGTVLLARGNDVAFSSSRGMASREFGVPNALDTKFNIGSINKIFTMIALNQLKEQGKLDFDETLRKALPDYPSPIADKITIRQLINHKSGLGDFFGPKYMEMPKNKLRSLSDYLPLFVDKSLQFEPGTEQRYSNAGFVVLGLVIEKLSGMSYYDYVRANIFECAGMKSTDSFALDQIVPKRATGYTRRGPEGPLPERTSNIYTLPARGSSAGGGYTTAPDLLRFAQAMRDGKFLANSPKREGSNPIGIAGGSPGVNAALETDDQWTIIVLSNYDPPSAEEVAQNIRKLLGLMID